MAIGWTLPAGAADAAKACALLTPAEIESATGLKISNLNPGTAPGSLANPGTGDPCFGIAPRATILLRLAKKSGAAGREVKGIETVKKLGAQVELKNFGPITCSALVPPANLAAQIPFNTTCTVTKGDTVAGIEVTARSQKDMVSIDKLRPLGKKSRSGCKEVDNTMTTHYLHVSIALLASAAPILAQKPSSTPEAQKRSACQLVSLEEITKLTDRAPVEIDPSASGPDGASDYCSWRVKGEATLIEMGIENLDVPDLAE